MKIDGFQVFCMQESNSLRPLGFSVPTRPYAHTESQVEYVIIRLRVGPLSGVANVIPRASIAEIDLNAETNSPWSLVSGNFRCQFILNLVGATRGHFVPFFAHFYTGHL